jgi:adenylate cyclase
MAIQIIETLPTHLNKKLSEPVSLRVGISLGPVIAGVIGTERIMYDIYGGVVVSAQKMEQSGQVNRIQISDTFYEHLKQKFPERYIIEESLFEGKTQYFLSSNFFE